MSIKPRFADAILRGEKRFEFRKVVFSRHVDVVVVYVTVPTKRIVAEFDVRRIVRMSVSELWNHTREFAGIDEAYFREYFHGRKYGYAIEVGELRVYDDPLCPIEQYGVRPPQSFVYLHDA